MKLRLPGWLRLAGTTLALGAAGGGIFFWLHLPLAWLMGAMLAVTAAALSGQRMVIPLGWRNVMIAILGVMLGSAFSPALIDRLLAWSLSVAILLAVMALMTAGAYQIFRRIGRYDPVAAYFAATPGGLGEMAMIGESLGADIRIISLVHATRILLTVISIPLFFSTLGGMTIPPMPAQVTTIFNLDGLDALILIGCIIAGSFVGRRLKWPAANLVGPMVFSAALHLSGLSGATPPREIIALAQIVIGAAIGCRFVGLDLRTAREAAGLSLLSTIWMLSIAGAASALSYLLLGTPVAASFLAMAPGGLTEMSLIALSLHLETAFVSTMHIVRIALIVVAAPMLFHAIRDRLGRGDDAHS
ncbi:MAG: AbrB family transcriptional regulator [Alphaproteobacteria bacterium]|nr:AbrB family transcriptional regulator [Alphaproteobacteria bacterium]